MPHTVELFSDSTVHVGSMGGSSPIGPLGSAAAAWGGGRYWLTGRSRPAAEAAMLLRFAISESEVAVKGERPEPVGRMLPHVALTPRGQGVSPSVFLRVGEPSSLHSRALEVALVPGTTERSLFLGHTLRPLGEPPPPPSGVPDGPGFFKTRHHRGRTPPLKDWAKFSSGLSAKSKMFSGAFGAKQIRPKNFFGAVGASKSPAPLAGGGGGGSWSPAPQKEPLGPGTSRTVAGT